MTRHIDFEAIENFRDFGGYATACGRGLVSGRLFRSGDHSRATEADLARLRNLGVATIVDLRHIEERQRDPGRRWEGFGALLIESDITSDKPDWVEAMKTAPQTAEWWYQNTLSHYRENPFEPRHVDLFSRFLRAIGEADGAIVVHCAAGKDRTGLACALVHHLAGVAHEDMIADFLLTNDESRIARKMAQSAAFVERVTGRRPSDEAMRVASSVYPAFLDSAFDEIRTRCGSIDGYLEDVLGMDAALRQRIEDRLLSG
ncbi:MAG: tyrosine-protein phosphatase [Alphaproteobacteria bacterium]|nr:tyrosine-protein phosphatase [Alphaproteobacteria bacterium]MBU1516713.1 tyrosine-protein phosphatase [Alphaproteobacteria bacterium]MBU2095913.1 tyrosine-protein phosphatase [Alphaproteobacteria bacterium]MBU2153617.1 tyrosine-protein phosphatase [Alphaproteobacteria bacterium]MBU2307339.1 tyrosine-protein phosphatase [Alphaproteobacteria bacterium]